MSWPWFWRGRLPDPALAGALNQGRWDPRGPLTQIPFAVLDVETTGFHPYAADRIIALAALQSDTGHEFDTLVNPGRPIPGIVSDLTGICDTDVQGAPAIEDVLTAFFTFLGRRVAVAHMAPFDRAFLQAALRRAGRLRWVHPLLDTRALAHALFPTWGDYRLEHCASRLCQSVEGRHTALGDTRTTARVLNALLSEAARRGLHSWADLQHLLATRRIW